MTPGSNSGFHIGDNSDEPVIVQLADYCAKQMPYQQGLMYFLARPVLLPMMRQWATLPHGQMAGEMAKSGLGYIMAAMEEAIAEQQAFEAQYQAQEEARLRQQAQAQAQGQTQGQEGQSNDTQARQTWNQWRGQRPANPPPQNPPPSNYDIPTRPGRPTGPAIRMGFGGGGGRVSPFSGSPDPHAGTNPENGQGNG